MWTTDQQEKSLFMVCMEPMLNFFMFFLVKHGMPHCQFQLAIMSHSTDLQLDVKGCRDVYASFDKYVEVERLEGDNKYHAEKYGLQVISLN